MFVVSYSLWGSMPFYMKGVINTSNAVKEMYPSWKMWVYHNDTVPDDVLTQLTQNDVHLINVGGTNMDCMNSLWRFRACTDPNVDMFISRDVDSLIFQREVDCVNAWINSDKDFHIMRDHPYHGLYIAAGMFGIKKGNLMDVFKSKLHDFENSQTLKTTTRYKQLLKDYNLKGIDQDFLSDYIYPHTTNNRMVHVGAGLFVNGDIKIPEEPNNYIAKIYD